MQSSLYSLPVSTEALPTLLWTLDRVFKDPLTVGLSQEVSPCHLSQPNSHSQTEAQNLDLFFPAQIAKRNETSLSLFQVRLGLCHPLMAMRETGTSFGWKQLETSF